MKASGKGHGPVVTSKASRKTKVVTGGATTVRLGSNHRAKGSRKGGRSY